MSPIERIRSCIVLDGSARRRPFLSAVGRSGLDLPVDSGMTVGNLWLRGIRESGLMHDTNFMCRFVIDWRTPLPRSLEITGDLNVQIERDPEPWRGTGGVLRDLASEYDQNDYILVVSGVQIPVDSMQSILETLGGLKADVALTADEEGTSVGIKLIRCGALRDIPSVGYVDFKEQGLPKVARDYSVRVSRRREPMCLSIRERSEYLNALRYWHAKKQGASPEKIADVFDEGWSVFSVIEEGATVEPDVELMNSVILSGASVARGAEVMESVICGGQHVAPGETIIRAVLSREIARAVQTN